MDIKIVEFLAAFYSTILRNRVKIETKHYGFNFIKSLTADDTILDYIQLGNHLIHKYRLLNISESHYNALLQGHIHQDHNLCLYFDEIANNTLCFNLDHNFKSKSTEVIPEMRLIVNDLQQHLEYYGMESVCIESGRGYHVWCRFEKPIANQLLYEFMIQMAAKTLASVHFSNHDYHTIKFNFGPNPKVVNLVSLRIFGSRHVKTGSFTYVHTKDDILNEKKSWKYFRDYMLNNTIPEKRFTATHNELVKAIP